MAGNTFSWIGGTASANSPSDWSLIAGPVGTSGPPHAGDTVIITSGEPILPLDATLSATTVEVAGTAGVASILFQGDGGLTLTNPTVDSQSVIESSVQGQSGPGATVLDSLGTFINEGTIAANGTLGSSFTIDIAQGTSGNAGIFINDGEIDVASGNAMTIAVGNNAALYNDSAIQVQGGSLLITATGTPFDGGYAPVRGVVVIGGGGTVEINTGYTASAGGALPVYAFVDTANNLLNLDQAPQFSGDIVGFAAGDTIDIGAQVVTGLSYSAAGILTLQDGSVTVDSLQLLTGGFQTGSFAVSGGVAGSFAITTSGTDTAITTTTTNEVWSSTTGGSWGTASNWAGGVAPSAGAAVQIVGGHGGSQTITTGSTAYSLASLLLAGGGTTLQVSDSLTIGPNLLAQGGGLVDVANGGSLTVSALSQVGSSSTLLIEAGGTMTATGHANQGYANAGTIAITSGDTYALGFTGGATIDGALSAGGVIALGLGGGGFPAQVTVGAGGTVSDTSAVLDVNPTSSSVLTIAGTGASWTDAIDPHDPQNQRGYMLVGVNTLQGPAPIAGAATLTVGAGGTLTEQAYADIGVTSNSSGVANINSGGVWNIGLTTGGYIDVGDYGAGTLNIASGGSVAVGGIGTFLNNGTNYTGGGIGIGAGAPGAGLVSVSGRLSTSGSGIGVGVSGSGTLDVSGSGTVAVSGSGHGIGIAQTVGASGTLSVSGSQALVTLDSSSNGIGVGKAGTGLLEVLGGGTVSVSAGGISAGDSAGAAGAIVVSGAGSKITTNGTNGGMAIGKAGAGALTITDGGLVAIQGTGHDLHIAGTGAGPGGGSGVVALAAVGSGQPGGTLDIGGNAYVWAGGTLTLDSASGVDVGTSGSFAAGAVVVDAGHMLAGDGKVSAAVVDSGELVATNSPTLSASTGGTLEIAGTVSGTGSLVMAAGASLQLDSAPAAGPTIDFTAGAPEKLIFGSGPGTIATAISGVINGDVMAFGGLTQIASAVLNGSTLTVSGTSSQGAASYELTGLSVATGVGANLITGTDPASGVAYVAFAGSDVWQWINPGTGAANIASNWTLQSGASTTAGYPVAGDTAIVPVGTVLIPQDAQFISNTIEVGGTASVAAAVLSGDTAVTWVNPSVDSNSVIESANTAQSTASQTLLDITGRFVNQGSILANGAPGSSFTIDLGQGTNGVAGAFINYDRMIVSAGNAMTIVAGPGAAFFNASQVEIQGGTLDLTTSGTGQLYGGLAPTDGLYVISGGGTVEVNTGFPAGTDGAKPQFAFADTAGNVLKLDQPGQFGGRILGLGAGNTIDLGAVNIGTLAYDPSGLLKVEDASGSLIASLVLSAGSYAAGTFTVSGASATAGSFAVTGNGSDARISTSGNTAAFETWNGGSGTFTVNTNWSGGVAPGPADTALIASNGNTAYDVSTGTSAIAVDGLVVADGNATLQVADSLSVTHATLDEFGGTIDVLGTGSLITTALNQSSARASLLLEQGATLDLLGHPNLGFANAGTLVGATGGTVGLLAMGSVVVDGAVLNAGPTQAASGATGGFIGIGVDGGGTGASMLVQSGATQGATVTDTYAVLSSDPTSFGSLTISGPATTWTDAGDPTDTGSTRGYMLVGNNNSGSLVPYAGAASLLVTNQATLTEANYAVIGDSVDSAGSVTIGGQADWQIGTGPGAAAGFLTVGRHGQGVLTIGTSGTGGTVSVGSGGTFVSQGVTKVASYAVDIGQKAGAGGFVSVSQAAQLLAAGDVIVGDAGQAQLAVSGTVAVSGTSGIVIGKSLGAVGLAQVNGPGGVLEALSGSLVVGGVAGSGNAAVLAVGGSAQVIAQQVTINAIAGLDSGGSLTGTGTLTVTATGHVTGANGASIDPTAGGTATVVNAGTIEATSGDFEVNGVLAGSGTVQIDSGATMVVGGPLIEGQSFDFGATTAPTVLDFVSPSATITNAIQNLQAGDAIVLENSSTISNVSINGSTLTVTGTTAVGGGGPLTETFTNVTLAPGASQSFNIISISDPFTGAATAQGVALTLPCYAAGTRIATVRGAVPVERLRIGDLVRTAGGALRPVCWIGSRRLDLARHPEPRKARPIRILADAFADGAPTRDLVLSPDHAVFDRGRLVPIRLLVNDATILRETRRRTVTYFHVELDSHDLLLAEGLAAESYLDTGNRGVFENADAPIVLHPDFTDPTEQNRRRLAASCAPLVDAPQDVEPLWWRLADRAAALGFALPAPEMTDEPALALQSGGRRLRPLARDGACYRFAMPAGPAWLVSRSAYPSDSRPWIEDQRRLGVMVRRMQLSC
ncbi:MAG: Hint domain-containing protein, partial [Rhodospirillales bacterium]|nr:Hint domain-containing protein [Rhodospirillales bacterium]